MRALHRVDRRQPGELAAVGDEGDGVHARDVPVGLGHVADPSPDLLGFVRHVQPEHLHRPCRRHDEAEQRLDHRALACPVRAEQPDGTQGKPGRHVSQRAILPVLDRDGVERDHRFQGAGVGHVCIRRRATEATGYRLRASGWGPVEIFARTLFAARSTLESVFAEAPIAPIYTNSPLSEFGRSDAQLMPFRAGLAHRRLPAGRR